MTIIITPTNNPTPNRALDYRATFKDYEGGDACGFGASPELAKEDLLEETRCNVCGEIHYFDGEVPRECLTGDSI